MCDLLVERINLIATEKTMPSDISETVHTVVWAAPRTQVEELRAVKEQLLLRYGAQLSKEQKGGGRLVNADVEERLVGQPPSEEAKLVELESIAAEFDVRARARAGGCSASRSFASLLCPAAAAAAAGPL